MARKNHEEHARVTAICVDLALDGVEADIRDELIRTSGDTAQVLKRVLDRLRNRRVAKSELQAAGNC